MPSPSSSRASDLRLLVLGPRKADQTDVSSTAYLFSPFLTVLTNVSPSADITTFAGYTTHPAFSIKNKYYAADVTIWCDELSASDSEWAENMRSDEAREVREVIGGIVLLLPYIETKTDMVDTYCRLLADVNTVREMIEDDTGRDIATIAIVQDITPGTAAERKGVTDLLSFTQNLEDICLSDRGIFGWDVIGWQPYTEQSNAADEFGEKVGMPRVLEVLEQTDWSASITDSSDELAAMDDFLDDLDHADIRPRVHPLVKDPVAAQSDEFQREIMGLHFALEDQSRKETGDPESGDELEVDQMMSLMSRAAEIREEGATLSKDEREKFARKEVANLMREMKLV